MESNRSPEKIMKKFLFFLVAFIKLRLLVTFGLRQTSLPLYGKWWWDRPELLKQKTQW